MRYRTNVSNPDPAGTDTWTQPALNSPYTDGAVVCEYRLEPDGVVRLRGVITRNAAASGASAFTLPAGYRPATEVIVPVVTTPVTTATGRVEIQTSGNVELHQGQGTPTAYFVDISFSTV